MKSTALCDSVFEGAQRHDFTPDVAFESESRRPTGAQLANETAASRPKADRGGRVRRWIGLATFWAGLAVASVCLWKGATAPSNDTKPIEQIQVGQKVVVQAPAGVFDLEMAWKDEATTEYLDELAKFDPLRASGPVDTSTINTGQYRLVKLQAHERWPDGTVDDVNVETLLSVEWIEAYDIEVGENAWLPLDIAELGLTTDEPFVVQEIGPSPPLHQGPGRLVIATVNHLNRDVRELSLRHSDGTSDTVRVTGLHKFYSATRDAWLATETLEVGEELDGIHGRVKVVGNKSIPGTHRVYDFTVQGEHAYRVAKLGVLVHNISSRPRGPLWKYVDRWKARKDLQVSDSAARKRLNTNMGTIPEFVNHHVIPVSLSEHNLVVSAARGGWHMNRGISNGYPFRKNPFHPRGSTHPRHTKELRRLLDKLDKSADDLKLTDADKATLLQNLVDDLRKGFDRNLDGNLNKASLRDLLPRSWHAFLD